MGLKVEKNNIVKGVPTTVTPVAKEPELENNEKPAPVKAAAEGIVKQMEAKTYSCSECGLKTPSRMTYIQHVLNGCIMDMVVGGSEEGADNGSAIKKAKVAEPVPAASS